MIISDLNHVEVVAEATEVKGGGDVVQAVKTVQISNASIGGGNARNNILNVAASLPISVNTLLGVGVL